MESNGGGEARSTAAAVPFWPQRSSRAQPWAAAKGKVDGGTVAMSFLQLVRREMRGSLRKLLLMSSLGGISSAAILAAINAGAQAADQGKGPSLWAASLFVVSLYLFMKTQIYVTTTITGEIEAVIHRLRLRLVDQIRHSELLAIEQIGRSRFVSAIASDAAILAQASNTLCYSVQAPILLAFVGIYVAYLSFPAFVLSVIIVGLAGTVFHFRSRRLTEERAAASEQERHFLSRLTDFLDGFKEVRMHAGRSADLFDDAVEASEESANIKIRVQAATFRLIASSQAYMYLLLAIVVFVTPLFSDSAGNASITKTTTALLFVIGAFFGLVQSIPISVLNVQCGGRTGSPNWKSICVKPRRLKRRPIGRRGVSTRSRCATSCFNIPTSILKRHFKLDRWTSPCRRAISSLLPVAMVQENPHSCACWRDFIPSIPAK